MDKLIIKGPTKLAGRVRVHGSKNSALPLLFGSLLFDSPVHYENVPRLWDVETTLRLLGSMGVRTEWDKEAGRIAIDPTVSDPTASYEWVSKMRAGILALGPLIARCGTAKVSLPGGCAIGARPVNFHLMAMERFGATVSVEGGYILASVKDRLRGANIDFPEVSVTGTENVLFVAAGAEGTTRIRNAAREPEILATGEFLKACGARIEGLGTSEIVVEGTSLRAPLSPVAIRPDRIECGTWITAAAITKSPLVLENCRAEEMTSVLSAFRDMGVGLDISEDGTTIAVHPGERLYPLRIETAPYPGFPTDMQAQFLALMCLAEGTSQIVENIFENRFMHVAELRRLGAKIRVRQNTATVLGPCRLVAAPLMATDLRASASLVLAALAAEGETTIRRIYHLDRGYARLDRSLRELGADVRRETE
ncbi:MAG: UDP-N-acetylglucosamine 1-carboxyvinyltransferase [Bdellovibrionaceae bacterium]|nr:UDP-N-acetylglucosamine 1-carboxyvinyltransferase [Pseudobdellovibrionaceae bacterium]